MKRLSLVLVALLCALPSMVRAQARCTVTGRPDRLAIFVPTIGEAIVVSGHPSDVVLEPAYGRAVGHVRSPIAFEGTVDPLVLLLHARRGRALADGTVRLGADGRVRLLEDGIVVTTIAPGATVTLPSLPCDALTLTPDTAPDASTPRPQPMVTHSIAASRTIALHASADGTEAAATLRTEEVLEVRVTDTRGARSFVQTDFGTARVDAWIDSSLLTAIEPHEGVLTGSASLLGGGACGRSDHPYAYDGPARVRAGVVIRSAMGLAWARVTRTLVVERIGVRAFGVGDVELLPVDGFESATCGLDLLFDLAIVSPTDITRRAHASSP